MFILPLDICCSAESFEPAIYLFGWIPCTGFHCPLPIAISTPICSAHLIASDSLFLLLVPPFKGLLVLFGKNNRSSSQAVKDILKGNKTKVLEVCYKTPYLCTTPQGRDGYSGRGDQWKKKGLTWVRRGNRKKKKKKNFKSFLEVRKRFLPLQSQRKRRETEKDKEGPGAHRNIADTEVEAQKFFKKTQSCKRDE